MTRTLSKLVAAGLLAAGVAGWLVLRRDAIFERGLIGRPHETPARVDASAWPDDLTSRPIEAAGIPKSEFAELAEALIPVASDLTVFVVEGESRAPVAGAVCEAALFERTEDLRERGGTIDEIAAGGGGRRASAVTDARGRARFDGAWRTAVVEARTPLYGGRTFCVAGEEDYRIALRDGAEVVVVRADGKPAAVLRLESFAEPDAGDVVGVDAGLTGPSGRLFVARPTDARGARWFVRPEVLGVDLAVEVARGRAEPVVIRLPPLGTLRVKTADPRGAPFREACSACATPKPIGVTGATRGVEETGGSTSLEDGEGRWLYVALNRAFTVTVTSSAKGRSGGVAPVEGPRADGEESVVVVPCGAPALAAVGRAMFDDGTPIARARVVVTPRAAADATEAACFEEAYGEGETDDEGNLHVWTQLPASAPLPAGWSVEMSDLPSGVENDVRFDVAAASRDGTADLGVLVMKRRPVTCAGIVVDVAGNPVPDATVRLTEEIGGKWYAAAQGVIQDVDTPDVDALKPIPQSVRADRNGRFVFPAGDLPDAAARLATVAETADAYSFRPVPFVPGARDLRVVVEPTGSLTGSFLLGPPDARPLVGAPPVSVVVKGPAAADLGAVRPGSDDAFAADVVGTSFTARRLRVGPARVEFRSRFEDRVLQSVDVEVVAGGPGKDPRLQEVDLSASIERAALRVLDARGVGVAGANVEIRRSAGAREDSVSAYDGRVRLWFPRDVDRVVIAANGKRVGRVEAPRGDVDVRLADATPCEVVITLEGAAETTARLDAELVWAGPPEASAPVDGYESHPLNSLLRFEQWSRRQGGTRRTATTPEPGLYLIRVAARRSGARSYAHLWDDASAPRLTIREGATTAETTVRVTAAQIEAALGPSGGAGR
ncbi:MAG TPA: hypothetical protein VEI02_04440 [Planctomycetota bacterium]|nr:hypothetical protein [Planctomycetota bacterium]